jgi:hypothetical protein
MKRYMRTDKLMYDKKCYKNIQILAASPLAPSGGPVGRGCAPPNHQVQLRCNTGGASPHFSEEKNHATSNSLTLDNMRKAQRKKLFIFP